jgi:SAM-dependent methyltransferase
MNDTPQSLGTKPLSPSGFWDALAPHLSAIENNYLNLPSIRRIMSELEGPVLVVGAGQGLIVEELQKRGFQCDGVDFSAEMIRYAKSRRGIALTQADARSLPMTDRTYSTVIYATGVIDFTEDEKVIEAMLREGKRVVRNSGKIFVAFYRMSAAQEAFMERVGLLSNHAMVVRKALELHPLNLAETIGWIAREAGVSYFRAAILLLRLTALSTMREKVMSIRIQRIFRRMGDTKSLVNASPETQPYRNEAEIRRLFERIGVPLKQIQTFASCYIARI